MERLHSSTHVHTLMGERRAAGAVVCALALALVAGFGASAVGASPSPRTDNPLGHEGRWITDSSGRVVILHGLNMVNKRAPYTPAAAGFGTAAAATLASNGFDVVRLGVLYQAVEPSPGVRWRVNPLPETVQIEACTRSSTSTRTS